MHASTLSGIAPNSFFSMWDMVKKTFLEKTNDHINSSQTWFHIGNQVFSTTQLGWSSIETAFLQVWKLPLIIVRLWLPYYSVENSRQSYCSPAGNFIRDVNHPDQKLDSPDSQRMIILYGIWWQFWKYYGFNGSNRSIASQFRWL